MKITGPDLDELERIAERVKAELDTTPGVENAGVFRIKGQPNLELSVDRRKCRQWNISVADVENAIKVAVGGQAFTQMIEGEKTFDITLRWPEALRGNEEAILDVPVDVTNNKVTSGTAPGLPWCSGNLQCPVGIGVRHFKTAGCGTGRVHGRRGGQAGERCGSHAAARGRRRCTRDGSCCFITVQTGPILNWTSCSIACPPVRSP